MEYTFTVCLLELARVRASLLLHVGTRTLLDSIALSSQLHSIPLFPLPLSPVNFPSFSFVAFTVAREKTES